MPQLKDVQKKVPGAHTLAGRVIAFYKGKHYDLGHYVGDGVVLLSTDGEKLMKPAKAKAEEKSAAKGLDLDNLEV